MNELAPKYLSVVRADVALKTASNRCWEVHVDEVQTAGVKATAGSLINREKLGQGLVNQICQGLLGESTEVPKEFLDILQDAMLRAATSVNKWGASRR